MMKIDDCIKIRDIASKLSKNGMKKKVLAFQPEPESKISKKRITELVDLFISTEK